METSLEHKPVLSLEENQNIDTFYPMIEPPEFSETMRKIHESDPVHADLMNALFQQLLNNDRVLKIEKADKSIRKEATLSAAGWQGEAAPYQYILELEEATKTNHIEIQPTTSFTTEQYETWTEAGLIGGNQSIGSITLLAYGEKPVIDLPIVILVRGD